MRARDSRTGVCIVRVEAERGRVLVTVTTDGDVGRNMRVAPLQRVMRFAEYDHALAAVAQFLRSFSGDSLVPDWRQ
jgi:hypothetical protein